MNLHRGETDRIIRILKLFILLDLDEAVWSTAEEEDV